MNTRMKSGGNVSLKPGNPNSDNTSELGDFSATSYDAVFSRLMAAVGTSKAVDVANALGISQQSISGAKAKQKIPEGWLTAISDKYRVSVDWLRTGEGEMKRTRQFVWTDIGLEEVGKQGIKDPGPLRGDETCIPYTSKPAASGHDSANSPNIADLVAKTIEVLQSGTVFQTALESNIEAFHQAIALDKKIDQVEERIMSKVSARFESLEEENRRVRAENEQVRTENTQLRQELEQSRSGSALSDTG